MLNWEDGPSPDSDFEPQANYGHLPHVFDWMFLLRAKSTTFHVHNVYILGQLVLKSTYTHTYIYICICICIHIYIYNYV